MPHTVNSGEIELNLPVEKKDQQVDQENHSLSIIPFPEIMTGVPDMEEGCPGAVNVNVTTNTPTKPEFSLMAKRFAKFAIFLIVVGVLFYGRFSVPDNPVPCIVDKILDGLKVPNQFILTPGRESYRRGFQILGSLLIDLTFLGTFGYWVFKGNSLRLPISLGVFYIIRALIQKFWFMPYTEGFYWDDPGFPSLVVPYGRGSDFFYSGHTGFVVICARESFVSNNKKTSVVMSLVLVYTIFTLLIYRIHYSIDIFVGGFFADYCFLRVQQLCNALIDPLAYKILLKLKSMIKKKKPEPTVEAEASR